MKKAIIYSIVISFLLIAGAYYYFFILKAEPEAPSLPSKVKIIMPPITSSVASKNIPKVAIKEEKKPEAKKEEPKQVTKLEKKAEPKKEEVKKIDATKQTQEKKEDVKKEESKKIELTKKPRFYQIEAVFKDEPMAISIKDNLISLGYHTAKISKKGSSYYVILSPFTDYYEAEYVRKNIEIEAKRSEFKTKAVY